MASMVEPSHRSIEIPLHSGDEVSSSESNLSIHSTPFVLGHRSQS